MRWALRRPWLAIPALLLANCWLALALWDAVQGERSDVVFWTGAAFVVVALVALVLVTVRFLRRLFRRPDPAGRAPDHYDQELLDKHRPVVRLDRQYDYCLLSAAAAAGNEGNLLRRFDGEVIAGRHGMPALDLELLSHLASDPEARDDDCVSMAPDYPGDARQWERSTDHPPCVYGRVVEDGERKWLQYWFWLYYNPKNLFGFGKHEGDWEMVQIGLGRDGDPEVATYAQHEAGETRKFKQGPRDMDLMGHRPVVYIAPYSHASYFKGGITHPYLVGIDQAVYPFDGGPNDSELPVVPFAEWVKWKGRWGNSERTIARRIGNGPPSPSCQGPEWDRPAAWHRRMGTRWLRVRLGRAIHRLGRNTYPPPPQIREVRRDGNRVHVHYLLLSKRLRRARHLYLTVHDGDYVIASRPVRNPGSEGHETLVLTGHPGAVTVYASAFNRLRQRSELTSLGET